MAPSAQNQYHHHYQAAHRPPFNGNLITSSPMAPMGPTSPRQLHQDRLANQNIIHNRYLLERTIGKGSYGKVKLAIDLDDPQRQCKRALKFIAIDSIKKPAHVTRLRRETVLLRCLHHPHLVKLHDHFQTNDDLVLVLEHVNGQDLFDRITKHPQQRLPEPEARAIFRQLVSALQYCHHHDVVHRDIKPENVMLTEGGVVKLIDFGFANWFDQTTTGSRLETNCGSPLYAAPEIVKGTSYRGPEVDCWSLGVVLVAMLTGSLPFEDDVLKVLYEKICRGHYSLPKWVSPLAADLIGRMLVVDGTKRANIFEIGQHPWLKDGFSSPPDPHIPTRLPLTCFEGSVIKAMAADLNVDLTMIRQELQANPTGGAFYHLYRLYREQVDRETHYSKNHLLSLHSAPEPGHLHDWIRVSRIDVNNEAPPLNMLYFDCDYLMRCVNKHTSQQQQQQPQQPQYANKRRPSVDINHPQPTPHHNFIQQAVGHLNSQFKRIKNMINQTSVNMDF